MILWIYNIIGAFIIAFAIILWYKMVNKNKTPDEIIDEEIQEIKYLRKNSKKN